MTVACGPFRPPFARCCFVFRAKTKEKKKNRFCAPETHTLQPFPFSKDLKTGNGGRVVPSVEKEKWIIVDRV